MQEWIKMGRKWNRRVVGEVKTVYYRFFRSFFSLVESTFESHKRQKRKLTFKHSKREGDIIIDFPLNLFWRCRIHPGGNSQEYLVLIFDYHRSIYTPNHPH